MFLVVGPKKYSKHGDASSLNNWSITFLTPSHNSLFVYFHFLLLQFN